MYIVMVEEGGRISGTAEVPSDQETVANEHKITAEEYTLINHYLDEKKSLLHIGGDIIEDNRSTGPMIARGLALFDSLIQAQMEAAVRIAEHEIALSAQNLTSASAVVQLSKCDNAELRVQGTWLIDTSNRAVWLDMFDCVDLLKERVVRNNTVLSQANKERLHISNAETQSDIDSALESQFSVCVVPNYAVGNARG